MTAPRIVALDLSLTSTGYCDSDGMTGTIRTNAADRLEVRLACIVTGVRELALDPDDGQDLVVIEDLPVHARAAGLTGPVHGAVRLWLFQQGIPLVTVPPASVKSYGAGKGNATKPDMRMALYKRAGLDIGDDNQVDAWWLRAMALDAYGHPVVDVPASHRKALERIDWPTLDTKEVA